MLGQTDSRSSQAKAAFADKDVDQSKLAHLLPVHKEETNEQGKYAKPIVFGGLDGVSTIFAFLAGAVGAELSIVSTVALGCAQLFAGALGMGLGEYLSSKAENDVASREKAREEWEVENNP
jgi:DNA damage-binding protein 1